MSKERRGGEMPELDYAVANPDDVAPIFFRQMLIQHMALRVMSRVPDMDLDSAMGAAVATYETEWDSDPVPRTFKLADAAMDSELEYWTED